jgi:hypothetical protein
LNRSPIDCMSEAANTICLLTRWKQAADRLYEFGQGKDCNW